MIEDPNYSHSFLFWLYNSNIQLFHHLSNVGILGHAWSMKWKRLWEDFEGVMIQKFVKNKETL